MGEWLPMSGREAYRLGAIQAAARRQIRQAQAAAQLELTVRQVKRPANAISEAVRERALPGFFAHAAYEKLT